MAAMQEIWRFVRRRAHYRRGIARESQVGVPRSLLRLRLSCRCVWLTTSHFSDGRVKKTWEYCASQSTLCCGIIILHVIGEDSESRPYSWPRLIFSTRTSSAEGRFAIREMPYAPLTLGISRTCDTGRWNDSCSHLSQRTKVLRCYGYWPARFVLIPVMPLLRNAGSSDRFFAEGSETDDLYSRKHATQLGGRLRTIQP